MTRLRFALVYCVVLLIGCGQDSPAPDPAVPEPIDSPTATTTEKSNETQAETSEPEQATAPGVVLTPPTFLTDEEIAAGWLYLFDGQTLFGWEANSETEWRVADGSIVTDSETPGLLVTNLPFADFEFRCEFQLAPGGNSGLFFRSEYQPSNPARDCYELNICDTHDSFATGSLVGRAQPLDTVNTEGEWHRYFVRMEGNHIEVLLDDQLLVDLVDETDAFRKSGRIGLQQNKGHIQFRNIAIRPVGSAPLFNGTDLTGWKEVPGSESEFSVQDGAIHVVSGKGFLETEEVYDDFIFQAEVRTNGDQLNSGFFFRAITGTSETPDHGYEYQIHNGYDNDNRQQPNNMGTGAIFRRAAARYVPANDHEWFSCTLAVHGSRMMTWVDGYPVVVWEDTRDPDENPRKGQRLHAGHISIQGHDPTTDLDLKNLRIMEYPE